MRQAPKNDCAPALVMRDQKLDNAAVVGRRLSRHVLDHRENTELEYPLTLPPQATT